MRNQLKKVNRIVIKLGTNTIIDDNGKFNYCFINGLIEQISHLKDEGKQIIIISSGAIGLGNNYLGWQKTNDLVLNQCSASVGQNLLMNSYANCFNKYSIAISQLLLTHEDINDPKRNANIKCLIERLMSLGIITIINENDSISTEEITFGDNDILSARVSNLIDADLLILLSDINGLYKNIKYKEIVDFVENIDLNIRKYVDENRSKLGKGGMHSKLIAAQLASHSNTFTVIASSIEKDVIKRIIRGENIGTLFYLNGGIKK
ncbi:MAG: glutamate 5-kinase [Candidatus Woesearchaeota archaeon]